MQKQLERLPSLLTCIVLGLWLAYWTWLLLPYFVPSMIASAPAFTIAREKTSQELVDEISASPWFSHISQSSKAEAPAFVSTELQLVGILSSQTASRPKPDSENTRSHAVALLRLANGRQIQLALGQTENTPQGEIRLLDIDRNSVHLRVQAEVVILKLHEKANLEIPVLPRSGSPVRPTQSDSKKNLNQFQDIAASGHDVEATNTKKAGGSLPASKRTDAEAMRQPAPALQADVANSVSTDDKYQPAESALSKRRKQLSEAHMQDQNMPQDMPQGASTNLSQNTEEHPATPSWWHKLRHWWGD